MKKPTNKLHLTRETIRNLQPDELRGAAGASDETSLIISTIVATIVISRAWTCICPKPQ